MHEKSEITIFEEIVIGEVGLGKNKWKQEFKGQNSGFFGGVKLYITDNVTGTKSSIRADNQLVLPAQAFHISHRVQIDSLCSIGGNDVLIVMYRLAPFITHPVSFHAVTERKGILLPSGQDGMKGFPLLFMLTLLFEEEMTGRRTGEKFAPLLAFWILQDNRHSTFTSFYQYNLIYLVSNLD